MNVFTILVSTTILLALCAGYRKFFAYVAPYFEAMSRLIRAGHPAAKIMDTDIAVLPPRTK